MKLSRSLKIALAIALIILLAILLIPLIRVGLKTIAVAVNVLIPQGDWRPLQWLTETPLQEKQEIQSVDGRTLTLYMYRPAAKKPRSALIIYTPLIGPGPQDPRLINLADTFVRSGFVAVIPWRFEDQQIITPKDIGDVVSTALFLKNHPELKIEKLGLMGLSYGNGPTIAAAADPRIRDDVSFVVSFGGYYDLQNAAQFLATGNFSYGTIEGNLEPADYARDILKNTLAYHGLTEENFLESTEFAELRRVLSPSQYIERSAAEFFILHSTDDRYIPYTESMRLRDALSGRVPTQFALTTIFEHGDYKPLTWQNIRRLYLPTAGDFYKFLYLILSKYL